MNLAFIRLMRDIEQYYLSRVPDASVVLTSKASNTARNAYLARFADEEGSTFLRGFYEKYHGQSADQSLEILVRGIHPTAQRLAVIYRSVTATGEDRPVLRISSEAHASNLVAHKQF